LYPIACSRPTYDDEGGKGVGPAAAAQNAEDEDAVVDSADDAPCELWSSVTEPEVPLDAATAHGDARLRFRSAV
jgi:hypothetical protein